MSPVFTTSVGFSCHSEVPCSIEPRNSVLRPRSSRPWYARTSRDVVALSSSIGSPSVVAGPHRRVRQEAACASPTLKRITSPVEFALAPPPKPNGVSFGLFVIWLAALRKPTMIPPGPAFVMVISFSAKPVKSITTS